MKFPITVKSMSIKPETKSIVNNGFFSPPPGTFVSIRPVNEEKTFLGIFIGDAAFGFHTEFDKDSGNLEIEFSHHNPAIFVPDLNRVVYGRESWWKKINSPKDLEAITETDINNVWYMKALQALGDEVDEAIKETENGDN